MKIKMAKRVFLSFISGVIPVFAFPPFGFGLLAWIGFVPLLRSIEGERGVGKRQGFMLGFISGFAFYLGTIYWVVHSMYFYGGVPVWISVPVMLLLVLYMSLYTGFFGLLFSATGAFSGVSRIIIVPSLWVALEYLRGYLFTGFPWALLGYSQANTLPVIQIADTTGVWGISFLIMLVNTVLYLLLKAYIERSRQKPLKEALIAAIVLSSVVTYGFLRINQVDKDSSGWPRMRVGIAQGSIDQSVKWDESFREKTVDIYRELSVRASGAGARLIIWPETAVPFYLGPDRAETRIVADIARDTGSFILTGSPSYNYNLQTQGISYFNSAYLLTPSGEIAGRYDKLHLVPFGEYVPLKRFLPFIKKLTAGVGDFSTGPGTIPIGFDGGRIGTLICYESIFPEISRGFVKNGANILVNITNDAWFGRTSAPYQHFDMAILRAAENKTFLLRAANTGVSAVIDPVGRVLRKTPLFERTVFTEDIGLRRGTLTFYSLYGDIFAYGCLTVSGVFILCMFIRRNKTI